MQMRMRVMGRWCCGNGSSGPGMEAKRRGPNAFLAGGPKFEVTPLAVK